MAKGDHRGVHESIGRLLAQRTTRVFVGPTVADVCGGYVGWLAAQDRSPLTVKGRDEDLRRWVALVGPDLPASSIGPDQLWAWKRSGRGHYRQVVQSVKAAWGWASRPIEGRVPIRLLEANALAGFPVPPSKPLAGRALPWVIVRTILRRAWSYGRQRADARIEYTRTNRRLKWLCLAVITWTGLRPREAFGLRWDEWDGRGFRPAPDRIKTRRFRPAPLPPRLAQLVEGMRRWPIRSSCFSRPAGGIRNRPTSICSGITAPSSGPGSRPRMIVCRHGHRTASDMDGSRTRSVWQGSTRIRLRWRGATRRPSSASATLMSRSIRCAARWSNFGRRGGSGHELCSCSPCPLRRFDRPKQGCRLSNARNQGR